MRTFAIASVVFPCATLAHAQDDDPHDDPSDVVEQPVDLERRVFARTHVAPHVRGFARFVLS